MAHGDHAGEGDVVDEGDGTGEIGHAVAYVGAESDEALARVLLGDRPVRVDGLGAARHVMDAQDARAVLDGGDADALGCRVTRGRVGHAGDGAHEALAGDGAEQWIPHRDHRARGSLDDDVLVGVLVEARTRVDADAVVRHAGPHEVARLIAEEAHDLAHDRRLVGQGEAMLRGVDARHCLAGGARVVELDLPARRTRPEASLVPVHDDAAAVGVGSDLNHRGAGESLDVVDDGGAETGADLGDVRVARVHGDDRPGGDERADDGHDAACLLVRGDGLASRTRGLATDVDDVGALVEHLAAACDGRLRVEVLAAVREGVRRHVENPHDAGAREREFVRTALPSCVVLPEHLHLPPAPDTWVTFLL